MKIGVIGGGSIGLLVARYLCENHDVTVYVRRNQQKQKLNDHGLFLSSLLTPCRVKALLTNELNEEECVIVCVKQPEVGPVLALLSNLNLNEKTPLIFLQNGMGHIELIHDSKQPVYLGIVTHGALRKSDHIVTHSGKGLIKVANFSGGGENLSTIVQQLNSKQFPFQIETNWEKVLAEKLVINAVINPLTAIFEVPNGEILRNTHLMVLAKELCRESCSILQLDFMDQWNHVQTVVTNTKENVSSMWKDLKERKKTENEAISGYLVKKTNSAIPYTTFVYNSMKALEVKKGINE
ncbi:2-dehydropantoate 2-reductase [Virgibacillus necropolis]|uniref:2-dehydropantoate 2-reductase n=1 Tax=Virgibacillus necropolis TaxID=163877 RepID=A0A221MDZ6_9BACI|nr:2-dehydropantoate 2-reductase [Virgibacillus necropolis]ASN05861.1 2-dehydropantoate 2-reductase [Virgibacillus necropolis]